MNRDDFEVMMTANIQELIKDTASSSQAYQETTTGKQNKSLQKHNGLEMLKNKRQRNVTLPKVIEISRKARFLKFSFKYQL